VELKSIERHVVRVPLQPRSEVPRYLGLADVLVQPGRAGAFNDYRLPSKLPEFFATGRPVVLPATNLGTVAADGEECLLLRRGDALEIAAVVERVLDDGELRERLRAAPARSRTAPSAGRERIGSCWGCTSARSTGGPRRPVSPGPSRPRSGTRPCATGPIRSSGYRSLRPRAAT
jgi:glycosyltransferase involved in cell wall biosynthesis